MLGIRYWFLPTFTFFFRNEGVKWGLLAGTVFGYICYDLIHYFLHHAEVERAGKKKYWGRVKQYHMRHHYKQDYLGFGVSQKLWDVVFGTEIKG